MTRQKGQDCLGWYGWEIFEWHVYVRVWTMCGWEIHRCEVNCDTWLGNENFPCHQYMSLSNLYAKKSGRTWRIGESQICVRTDEILFCVESVGPTHKNDLVLWQQVFPLILESRCPRLSFNGLEKFLCGSYSGRSERLGWETHLQVYMQLQQVSNDTNPLMWWKQYQQEFPDLARIARQYLTEPATSVSPERFFSRVGLVQTDLWGSLLDTTMIDLM